MAQQALQVDVGSTLVALARTLDSDQLGAVLGLTTMPAPDADGDDQLGAVELSGEQRYETLDTLGEGGMGHVAAVWDRDLLRELALKQLHPRLAGSGQSLRQFLWEARVTAHLDHPNIVPVHDIGLDGNGALFFTMKRVRGRSLAELIEVLARLESRRLAEVECCHRCECGPGEDELVADYGPRRKRLRVFFEICQAIAYAHRRGVLHRDLKPANVMIGEFGEVLVMDWGLAVPLSEAPGHVADGHDLVSSMPQELRDTGDKLYGTPRYMAPELLRGEAASVRSDVYALGVLLYELMCFRRPHDADSVPALVLLISEGQVTPLRTVAPQVPSSIAAVVEKAMATDPEQRYADVPALIEDIDAVLEGLTPSAEQVSTMTRARRYVWSRDNPATAGIRLVDIDLTAGAGMAVGVAGALAVTTGIDWFVIACALAGVAMFTPPALTYLRAIRAGQRRRRGW